uniref:Uncharacterized protein n=1 Tax=Physcomitrium patens TaxID=3218 RepID=A0A2K1IDK0_PHYPA|nr:hypothetical protein PHYPA_029502 [Physcomitrium patens]
MCDICLFIYYIQHKSDVLKKYKELSTLVPQATRIRIQQLLSDRVGGEAVQAVAYFLNMCVCKQRSKCFTQISHLLSKTGSPSVSHVAAEKQTLTSYPHLDLSLLPQHTIRQNDPTK